MKENLFFQFFSTIFLKTVNLSIKILNSCLQKMFEYFVLSYSLETLMFKYLNNSVFVQFESSIHYIRDA